MGPDLLPSDLLRALLDPTAPLPAGWPTGGLGAFLLFLVPIGGGIPLGVLMASRAGLGPLVVATLYLVSDVVLAFSAEPGVLGARWLGRRIPALGRLGDGLARLTVQTGLGEQSARGPLGLVLVSFAVSPTTGRAAAAAAGHGFVPGWSLAIAGDMGYFALLMTSTLWLDGVLGDGRVTVGVTLLLAWVLPLLLRRLRWPTGGTPVQAVAGPLDADAARPTQSRAAAAGRSARRRAPHHR